MIPAPIDVYEPGNVVTTLVDVNEPGSAGTNDAVWMMPIKNSAPAIMNTSCPITGALAIVSARGLKPGGKSAGDTHTSAKFKPGTAKINTPSKYRGEHGVRVKPHAATNDSAREVRKLHARRLRHGERCGFPSPVVVHPDLSTARAQRLHFGGVLAQSGLKAHEKTGPGFSTSQNVQGRLVIMTPVHFFNARSKAPPRLCGFMVWGRAGGRPRARSLGFAKHAAF